MMIIRPVVTEKASSALADNKYTFYITPDANKIGVKKEVEKQFNVEVIDVNICMVRGKKRRRGRIIGSTKDRKKAIVTLKSGQEIEMVKGLF